METVTLSNKSPCSCDSFLRSINLKFILSKIFLDLCITSDKTQSSPPLTFTFTQRGPFHLPESPRIKSRSTQSDR